MHRLFASFRGKTYLFILVMMAVPLFLTYFAWRVSTDNLHDLRQAKFETLAKESERALWHRMESYKQALLGGKGFFEGSTSVHREEWKSYVDAADVLTNFPGINGIGTIYDVPESQVSAFLKEARADGYPTFRIHPDGKYPETFVIKYIEPLNINVEAVGLNIGFEEHRREAAIKSRESGKAAITKRILLVQDAEKTPGFLLLLPTYEAGCR